MLEGLLAVVAAQRFRAGAGVCREKADIHQRSSITYYYIHDDDIEDDEDDEDEDEDEDDDGATTKTRTKTTTTRCRKIE